MDSDLSADTIYQYAVQGVVVDNNDFIIYGEFNRAYIKTNLENQSINVNAIISTIVGASVGGIVALIAIIAFVGYFIYRKVRKVNDHIEDIKLDSALQVAEESQFDSGIATPIKVTTISSESSSNQML